MTTPPHSPSPPAAPGLPLPLLQRLVQRLIERLPRTSSIVYLTLLLIAAGMALGQRWSERAGTEQLAAVAAERLELYAASLEAELARHAYLPSLMAIDADLQALLAAPDDVALQQRAARKLAGIKVRSGLSLSFVTDADGRVLASSESSPRPAAAAASGAELSAAEAVVRRLGAHLRSSNTHFFAANEANGSTDYFLLHNINRGGRLLGQIVLRLNLAPLEATWVDQGLRSQGEKLLVVDDNEVVIMSSVPNWKYQLLSERSPAERSELQTSGRYAGPLRGALNLFGADGLQDEALLVDVPALQARPDGSPAPSQKLLAQQRALLPLALRLVTLSDPAEVWRQSRYAAWAGGAVGALIGLLALYLASRRRAHTQLLQASEALRLAHAQLEAQVAERTQELSHTNEELKRQIAQRLQAEDELMQAAKLAVLGQMSAGIAHEVNQPLTALRALSRNSLLLLEKGRNATVGENLRTIDAMVERMTGITRQLKSFARKAESVHAPVSLAAAVKGARLLIEHRLQAEAVDFKMADELERVWVRCEPNRLEQVLVNLFANALDAMKDAASRRLEISTAPQPDNAGGSGGSAGSAKRVILRVSDSGAGMPADLLPRLFEPFFTTKPAGQGLGLGLVISSKIVHEFGGSLRAHARPADQGGGMTFEFDLEVSTRDGINV
ncbi:ATP-binding protein [Paucibacter sp. AS339]|uniref:sensor histidine kinase n=1 Tax=Paucibacter hankyongi TaxID=3133434 RepID=UPI0030A4F8ED